MKNYYKFAVPLKNRKAHKNLGPVVQLVRIPACHAGGREFESRPDRNKNVVLSPLNRTRFM